MNLEKWMDEHLSEGGTCDIGRTFVFAIVVLVLGVAVLGFALAGCIHAFGRVVGE